MGLLGIDGGLAGAPPPPPHDPEADLPLLRRFTVTYEQVDGTAGTVVVEAHKYAENDLGSLEFYVARVMRGQKVGQIIRSFKHWCDVEETSVQIENDSDPLVDIAV